MSKTKNENEIKIKLIPKREEFCKLYASDKECYANGVQSYIAVYEPNQSNPNWYKSACASASRLLSDVKVCQRINQILEMRGLNDMFVDKQLEFLITQHADFKTKLGSIQEYNKLKSRILKRIDHTTGGEPIAILGGQSQKK